MKDKIEEILALLNTERPYRVVCKKNQFPFYDYPKNLYELLYHLVDSIGADPLYSDHIGEVGQIQAEKLDLSQISSYLTWLVRGERFCDGLIAENIESGRLKSILERLLCLSS